MAENGIASDNLARQVKLINEPQGIGDLHPLAARRYRAHTLVQSDAKGREHMFGLAVGILLPRRVLPSRERWLMSVSACAPVSAFN